MEAALSPYSLALEAGSLGVPGPFSSLYHAYAAERGYVRSEFGHIWPEEPYPQEPGKSYTFAPGLFPNARTAKRGDCTFAADGATCVVTLSRVPALSARVVLVDFAGGELLPSGMSWNEGFSARFGAKAGSGGVGMTVFGEHYGEGEAAGVVGSGDGAEVSLEEAGKRWTNAKVLLVRGAGEPSDVTLTMTFGMAELSPACQQWVDVYCTCVVPGVEPEQECRVHTQLSIQQICDPVSGQLPPDMTCDEYCAQQVETYSGMCR